MQEDMTAVLLDRAMPAQERRAGQTEGLFLGRAIPACQ